jgi:hypothetical protein
MKTLALALMLISTSALANEVTLLVKTLPITRGLPSVSSKFSIDTDLKEGFAKVLVTEQYIEYVQRCNGGYPSGPICTTYPETRYNTVLTEKVKIEGMTTNGDDVIYQGTEGDVLCGTMKLSRVLRVPTLYLTGKCVLESRISNNSVVVKFKTK